MTSFIKVFLSLILIFGIKSNASYASPKINKISEDPRLGASIVAIGKRSLFSDRKPSKLSLNQIISALSSPGFLRYPANADDIDIVWWWGDTTKDWYAHGVNDIKVTLSKKYLQKYGLPEKYNGLVVHFEDVDVDNGYLSGEAKASVEVLEPIYDLMKGRHTDSQSTIPPEEHHLFCSGDGWFPSSSSVDGKCKYVYFGKKFNFYSSKKEYIEKDLSADKLLKDLLSVEVISQYVKAEFGSPIKWLSYADNKPVFRYIIKPKNLEDFKSNVISGAKYKVDLAFDSSIEYEISSPRTRYGKKSMNEIVQIILDPAKLYSDQGVFTSRNTILSVSGIGGLMEQKITRYDIMVYIKSIEPITE